MGVRRTNSILTDDVSADPLHESDVVITAAAIGFAASLVEQGRCVRFDLNPDQSSPREQAKHDGAVRRLDAAVAEALRAKGAVPTGSVRSGVSPNWQSGSVIMGVYELAGVQRPPDSDSQPSGLTPKGHALWEDISLGRLQQYTGIGAYTGFVDNHNTEGDTDPVGPMSTVRFLVTKLHESDPVPDSRWLPPERSPLWDLRTRHDGSVVPWGLISGNCARAAPGSPNPSGATNRADWITDGMRIPAGGGDGMEFDGSEPSRGDIVGYTHGMIQAIYKAYHLGPSCRPYEIAVGERTTKLASCLACSMFMVSAGYPPTSMHLGRGESWVPLYEPHHCEPSLWPTEAAVVRDLNGTWYRNCDSYLRTGLLGMSAAEPGHKRAVDDLATYLERSTPTTAATLILDALTIHEQDAVRINRALTMPAP